jgi:hypothetical protein
VAADQVGEGSPADLLGAEGLDEQGQRPGDPDRVGHLDLGPVGVVISPASTTSPVVSSVSTATREPGSSVSAASTIASEIWSATLSG